MVVLTTNTKKTIAYLVVVSGKETKMERDKETKNKVRIKKIYKKAKIYF